MRTDLPPQAQPRWPRAWRLLRSGSDDGVRNMAVDAALLARAARTGEAVLRVYGWRRPTVSFGRNEAVRHQFSAESLAAAGMDAVRRPTGGRALLHGSDITYSVALPIAPDAGWRAVYAQVNARLVAALRTLGVPAALANAPTRPLHPDGAPCFAAPDAGEVVVGGRKLVGSAVWREAGGYLQHGSILVADEQDALRRAMSGTASVAATSAIGLNALLPPDPHAPLTLVARMTAALADAFDVRGECHEDTIDDGCDENGESVTRPPHGPSFLADVERLEPGFRSPSWLWRR